MISVIFGSNQLAMQEKLHVLKQEFTQQHSVAGIEQFEVTALNPQDMRGILTGVTLFAENRFVIIKNLSSDKALSEALLECIEAIPREVHLVLYENQLDKRTVLYKTLKKHATFYELVELDVAAVVTWVQDFVTEQQGTIAKNVAQKLVEAVGTDQLRLKHEIEKLVLYNPKITEESIDELVEKTPQETIFVLLDAALRGDRKKTLSLLENMEQAHEDVFQIVNMLIWQTQILAVVHASLAMPNTDVAKEAKINPFVVTKTRTLAKTLSKQDLRRIIDAVAECDVMLKSSSADPWRVLEQTLLRI